MITDKEDQDLEREDLEREDLEDARQEFIKAYKNMWTTLTDIDDPCLDSIPFDEWTAQDFRNAIVTNLKELVQEDIDYAKEEIKEPWQL